MTFRPWIRFILLAASLNLGGCGNGSSGGMSGDGGAGGEGGAGADLPAFTISDEVAIEGNTGSADLTFTVTLSEPSSDVVKVAYKTEDDSAQADGVAADGGSDYDATSATLRFEPGETEQTFTVTVNGDTVGETDETFNVVLSKPVGAAIADGQATGTIENDDAPPMLPLVSITDASTTEGNAGVTSVALTVTLSEASKLPISMNYASADETANNGEDYVAASGAITFSPGQTSKTISLVVLGDTQFEPEETLTVSLSNIKNAELDEAVATLTILNDDISGPGLSIDDASVSEGSAGSKVLSFGIELSAASLATVTVDYATIDGTASASGLSATGGADYVAASDSITFAPGETYKQVDVTVYGDTLNEADETITVELFNGVNASVVDPQAVGTISNDDALPSITIDDVSLLEGAAGTKMATFAVSLAPSSGRSVSVNFYTSNGTAASGSDYVAASGTLTFEPGETSGLVSVTINGDLLSEADELFYVSLSGAVNASIADDLASGTVLSDDALPLITIDDVSVVEGDAGTTNAVFTVSLSASSGQDITVDWTTSNGTATSVQDYTAQTGSLLFQAGTVTRTISIAIKGDVADEANETFDVDLSNPLRASLSDAHGLGTIITDDSTLPGLNIDDASVTEQNAGSTTLTFTVTLDTVSAQQVTVNYLAANGTASAGSDYQAKNGTLTFGIGVTTQTINIMLSGDTLHEPDETLSVTLSAAVNAYIADGLGVGTIEDDDSAPTVGIDDVTLTEGNAGTKNATFTVSLSAPSGFQVAVSFATADGTALEGGSAAAGQDDYEASSDAIVFLPGETSAQITVPINGDLVPEPSETFSVQLSAADNATISDAQGQCTISNDDALPTISIADVSLLEGDIGNKTFTFSVTLSKSSGSQVSVSFSTANGSAVSPSDYTATSGSVVFEPGQTVATISVTVIGENAAEAHNDETFYVNLSSPMGATVADAQGLGTILSDD
jgi:urease beta subunit